MISPHVAVCIYLFLFGLKFGRLSLGLFGPRWAPNMLFFFTVKNVVLVNFAAATTRVVGRPTMVEDAGLERSDEVWNFLWHITPYPVNAAFVLLEILLEARQVCVRPLKVRPKLVQPLLLGQESFLVVENWSRTGIHASRRVADQREDHRAQQEQEVEGVRQAVEAANVDDGTARTNFALDVHQARPLVSHDIAVVADKDERVAVRVSAKVPVRLGHLVGVDVARVFFVLKHEAIPIAVHDVVAGLDAVRVYAVRPARPEGLV